MDKHILLRFSLGEPSFKQFVIVSGSDPPPEREIRQDEKIIVLLLDDIRPETFPYTRPVILRSGKRAARTASLPENNF